VLTDKERRPNLAAETASKTFPGVTAESTDPDPFAHRATRAQGARPARGVGPMTDCPHIATVTEPRPGATALVTTCVTCKATVHPIEESQ
jgi:hypothetical protein